MKGRLTMKNFNAIKYAEEMLDKYNRAAYKVIIEYTYDGRREIIGIDDYDPATYHVCGFCDPEDYSIHIYVGSIIRQAERMKISPEKLIRRVVRHECRHAQQFQYLRGKGGDSLLENVLFNEGFYSYGAGVLERDAILASFGITLPFGFVFRKLLKTLKK